MPAIKKDTVRFILTLGQFALLLLLVFSGRDAWGAKFSAQSSVSVSEQYNDNIYLTDKDRTTDYITQVLPSLNLDYKAPLWKWGLAYTLDFRHYLNGSVSDNFAHNLTLNNSTELLRKLFYLDVSERYTRSSLSLTRNYTQESLFVNQTDRNDFTAAPHFTLRPGNGTTLDIGYTYENIWYKNSSGINKQDSSLHADAKTEASQNLELTAGVLYLWEQNDIENFNKTNLYVGAKYRYAPDSHLFFTVGGNIYDFHISGTSDQLNWDAGIDHRFAAFTAKIEASSQFVEDPTYILSRIDTYGISLATGSARTPVTLGLNLSEYRDWPSEELRTTAYGITGAVSHNFTPGTRISANVTAQRYEDKLENSYTNSLISGADINYALFRNMSLSLDYLYIYSHSPVVLMDSYLNNQLTAGITVTF